MRSSKEQPHTFMFWLVGALASLLATALGAAAQSTGWPTHAHDEQHSGVSSVASQPLHKIRWSTPVDLIPPVGEILIHYGSPLVTRENTVIVPVKTGDNNFRIDARSGKTGKLLWTLPTNYQVPTSTFFVPPIGPTLSGDRLLVPDSAGALIVREDVDESENEDVGHLYFYGKKNFQAAPQPYTQNIQINTPISADSNGNLYFGFIALGPTPIGLESGLARIGRDGKGTWVSAATVSGDPGITKVAMNCAPALSRDGKILYVAVNSFDFGFGYLLALDSKTLAVINSVRLLDPSSGFDAIVGDEAALFPQLGPMAMSTTESWKIRFHFITTEDGYCISTGICQKKRLRGVSAGTIRLPSSMPRSFRVITEYRSIF